MGDLLDVEGEGDEDVAADGDSDAYGGVARALVIGEGHEWSSSIQQSGCGFQERGPRWTAESVRLAVSSVDDNAAHSRLIVDNTMHNNLQQIRLRVHLHTDWQDNDPAHQQGLTRRCTYGSTHEGGT